MAKLWHLPQQDEVPQQLRLDEDSDGWWAGVNLSSVAVPIARGLAVVALSASLCWGYQQQTDEIVQQPQVSVGDSTTWLSTALRPPVTILAWGASDDLPAFAVVEEEPWVAPWVVPRAATGLPPWVDEDLPVAAISEEDLWDVWTPPLQPPRFLYLPDPEEIPAGSLFGVPEDEGWVPPHVVGRQQPVWAFFADDEVAPVAVPLSVEEEYWWNGHWQTRPASVTVWATDDEVPTPPAGASVGSAITLSTAQRRPIILLAWGANDEVQVAPAPLPFDEDYQWTSGYRIQPPRPTVLLGDDALSPLPEETEWWPPIVRPQALSLQVWHGDDEITVQVLSPEEEYWHQLAWQPQPTIAWLPSADEEIVQPPVQDEDAWLVLPLWLRGPSVGPWPWWDDIQRVVAIFTITGITRDCAGAPLAGATVLLFRTSDRVFLDSTVSGGGGAYSFTVGDGVTEHFMVSVSADGLLFGTTRDDIVGT